jgi:dihydropteroate synthase
VGPSRKSFIGKILQEDGQARLWGTAAAVTCAVLAGAHVVRVHDVQQMRSVARVADALAETAQ